MFVYDYKLPTDITKTEADSSVNEYILWTYTYLKPLLCKFLALTPKFLQDMHIFYIYIYCNVCPLFNRLWFNFMIIDEYTNLTFENVTYPNYFCGGE